MENCCSNTNENQETRMPEMERKLSNLQDILEESVMISNEFENKTKSLLSYGEDETEDCNESKLDGEGYVPRLNEIINLLDKVNQKNKNTLKYLSELL